MAVTCGIAGGRGSDFGEGVAGDGGGPPEDVASAATSELALEEEEEGEVAGTAGVLGGGAASNLTASGLAPPVFADAESLACDTVAESCFVAALEELCLASDLGEFGSSMALMCLPLPVDSPSFFSSTVLDRSPEPKGMIFFLLSSCEDLMPLYAFRLAFGKRRWKERSSK